MGSCNGLVHFCFVSLYYFSFVCFFFFRRMCGHAFSCYSPLCGGGGHYIYIYLQYVWLSLGLNFNLDTLVFFACSVMYRSLSIFSIFIV